MIKQGIIFFIFAFIYCIKCDPLSNEIAEMNARIQQNIANMNARVQEQVANMNARIQEKIREQVRVADQRIHASLNASLNRIQNQIDEKRRSIESVDNRTYSIPTTLDYDGKQAYFNGQYFTKGSYGPRLNEQESEEAWAALRTAIERSLSSLLRAQMKLENTRSRFG